MIRTLGKFLLERTLVLGHWLCKVGWPVPFLAALISTKFPPGPNLLLGGQQARVQPLALTLMLPASNAYTSVIYKG